MSMFYIIPTLYVERDSVENFQCLAFTTTIFISKTPSSIPLNSRECFVRDIPAVKMLGLIRANIPLANNIFCKS
jgi:hypothetical protein